MAGYLGFSNGCTACTLAVNVAQCTLACDAHKHHQAAVTQHGHAHAYSPPHLQTLHGEAPTLCARSRPAAQLTWPPIWRRIKPDAQLKLCCCASMSVHLAGSGAQPASCSTTDGDRHWSSYDMLYDNCREHGTARSSVWKGAPCLLVCRRHSSRPCERAGTCMSSCHAHSLQHIKHDTTPAHPTPV